MALDQARPQDDRGGWTPSRSYSREDAELATRMLIKMMNEAGGLQVIQDAIQQSQDPAQVIGQFLAQIMGQLAEELNKQAGIDPGVFLAKEGVLEAILNYIEGKLGFPEDFSDQVYGQVLEVIKAAAQSPNGAAAPQQGAQQDPMAGQQAQPPSADMQPEQM